MNSRQWIRGGGLAVTFVAALAAATPAQAVYTSTVSGTTATMTGDAAGDLLVVYENGGLLAHSRDALGDPDFSSPFDWNTAVAGDQTIANAAGSAVTVNAGDGNDLLSAGLSGVTTPVSLIEANLSFNGQGDSDSLAIDDTDSSAGKTVTMSGGGVTFAAPGPAISVATVDSLTLNLGSGSDSVQVDGSPSLTATANVGLGDDTVTAGSASAGVAGILSPLTVRGNVGNDTFRFDDSAATAAHNYVVGADAVQRDGGVSVDFNTVESLALAGGTAADRVFKSGGPPLAVNSGDGDDELTIDDGVADSATCGAGSDLVNPDLSDVLAAGCEGVLGPVDDSCEQAVAGWSDADDALTAAQQALKKAKRRLKKAKRSGDDEAIRKAKKKVKKATKRVRRAKSAEAVAQAAVEAACL